LLKSWLIALAVMVGLVTPALAQPNSGNKHAEPSLLSERAAIVPGDQFQTALKLVLQDGWHVYWKNPGDSGEAPAIRWKTPDGQDVTDTIFGEFSWPTPEYEQVSPELANYVYKKQVTLPFQIKAPSTLKVGDRMQLQAQVLVLICSDICIPERYTLSFALPVEAAPRPDDAGSREIGTVLAAMPKPSNGTSAASRKGGMLMLAIADPEIAAAAKAGRELRFYPLGADVLNAKPQRISRGDNGVTFEMPVSELAAAGDIALPGVVALEGEGERKAWTVTGAPGALPAGTSGTAIVKAAAPVAAMSMLQLAGVLLGAFVGGLILNLMPCVLPVLSIKAAGLAHTAHDPRESRAHGVAYTAGVLLFFLGIGAVIVTARALGASLGVGFQLQYAPLVALFALVMFAIGLNLLGMFEIGGSLMGVGGQLADKEGRTGAFFTGALAALVGAPCTAPFMATAVGVALTQPPPIVLLVFATIGLGLAAPLLALSFLPAVARLIPRPGRWMETFRQALAFPMFLTVLWLLWVLAGQAGADAVIYVAGGAILLAFGIWLARKFGSGPAGKLAAGAVILAAMVIPAVASAMVKPESVAVAAPAAGHEAWSPALVKKLQAENRVIFVDFTARWCVTCQVNKGAMNSAEALKSFADHNVAFLEADWTNRNDEIAQELAKHERAGVPLYLVYPANGGQPEVLGQILTPGEITRAIEGAAKGATPAAT
jgi:thiol:disulfide interchange protein DsbD